MGKRIIIIPTYNLKETSKRLFDTFSPDVFDILVIDDGSPTEPIL